MTSTDSVLGHLEADHDAAVTRLAELLAIESVGTDSAYDQQTLTAANWHANDLASIGLDVQIMPTDGHPCVVAKTPDELVEDLDAPRVLFYGHYDVQPADPINLWTTGPFKPTVRHGAIYARGASDDKGQVMCHVEALRAWQQTHGKFPCPVTVLIEGEEEAGSINLPAFLDKHADVLAADIALVSDTSMWDASTPAITYALRGLVYFDVKLHGPSRDLHSGVYGGTLANPCNMLTRILGQLQGSDNRVTIPGFYDDVLDISHEERDRWQRLGFDEKAYLDDIGATAFGEAGYNTIERRWARPSVDVNGIYGGYMGEGAKTVIPTVAGAKVSFRIPPNMNPNKVADQFEDWLRQHRTGGCRWEITRLGEAWPVNTPIDSPFMHAAIAGLEQVTGKSPALVREGATIPVVADLQRKLGVETLLVGFGLNSDNIHSPNEHFGLDRFLLGCKSHAAIIQTIATVER